jgi:hypothetical protein
MLVEEIKKLPPRIIWGFRPEEISVIPTIIIQRYTVGPFIKTDLHINWFGFFIGTNRNCRAVIKQMYENSN